MGPQLGVSIVMEDPKLAGWCISWKIPIENGWELGVISPWLRKAPVGFLLLKWPMWKYNVWSPVLGPTTSPAIPKTAVWQSRCSTIDPVNSPHLVVLCGSKTHDLMTQKPAFTSCFPSMANGPAGQEQVMFQISNMAQPWMNSQHWIVTRALTRY